ncbi:alanyl-tRNA editing protein [Anaerosalibacter sp. Marseille-P3206]|uniref:alanyl-tRNA editing protein n=1 Tax=Anaerosalibacter sp. Marseille-P3206 TaxID=1871005 RepID=UPI000986FFD1|nr:DHHA1 domain-containing protein [Anaerosalibacter sp. Marseille-P3206]
MTEKIYLENPYIREISARIVNKKFIDNKFLLILNRTIFYPNLAGGQPKDKGTINGIKVIDVYEENNEIIHVVSENINTNIVHLSIDWNTRLDNMQQHTGQHLLSSVFYKLYNGQTVGFHIGETTSTIDVTVKNFNNEMVEKIETIANKIIYSNFDIKSYIIDQENIENIPLIKDPPKNENIRIVEIDGIDYSPCCGTHHRKTGEIGIIKIIRWDNYKDNTRIEFVCGNRALKDYSQKNIEINNVSTLLSSKNIDVFEKVEKLYSQKESLEKENRILKEKILEYKTKELLDKALIVDDKKYIIKIFDDIDFRELGIIASNFREVNDVICLLGIKANNKGQFLICRSKNININMMDIFKRISNSDIKGGGNSERVQGGCDFDEVESLLNNAFKCIRIEGIK